MHARLVRYTAVGAVGTGAHYALMFTLLPLAPPVIASTLGAIGGGALNFHLARRWVFPSPLPIGRSAPRFLAVALGGVVLNALVLQLLAPATGVLFAQLLATLAVLLGGFAANRSWSFGVRAA